jgi:pimeloyl-ACP methyl ester carboxylesterase
MVLVIKPFTRCIVLAAAGTISPLQAAPLAPDDTGAAFSKPHRLIDIGGRTMHLYCSGQGPVTVVFDAPSGEAGWSWYRVQPAVARHTRACVFDRAGLGFSAPAGWPNTSANVAEDLHKLLATAGIRPPYVMVGNSLGGGNVQVYAYRYPGEVKGLVLVEPQHEDLTARLDAASQGNLNKMYAMVTAQNNACLAAAQEGFAPGSEVQQTCLGDAAENGNAALEAIKTAMKSKPAYWRTNVDEWNAVPASDAQLRALRRPFGAMPLIVLTRGVSPFAVPGQPQSAVNKAVEDENAAIHRETAALSTRGKQRVVPDAGHVIQDDQPAAVVDAVLEVLQQID